MYEAKFKCSNCDRETTIKIRKGITISEFLETGICLNCGCKTLKHKKNVKDNDIFDFIKKDHKFPYPPHNKDFYREGVLEFIDTPLNKSKCMFDGLESGKTYGISCPCPRCSPFSLNDKGNNIE